MARWDFGVEVDGPGVGEAVDFAVAILIYVKGAEILLSVGGMEHDVKWSKTVQCKVEVIIDRKSVSRERERR
jgi:hypothetical protein